MHITLNGENGAVDSRTRAYAQYRVFDTFRSLEREIRAVNLSLSRQSIAARGVVTCSVTVTLASGDEIVATASADWPYAAIEQAVAKASRKTQ